MSTPEHHPLGPPWGTERSTCGSCAWSRLAGPGPKVLRCVAAGGRRTDPDERGCSQWEADLDCLDCAACCGPAFDAVEISPRDPVRKLHPDRVVTIDGRHQIPRTASNHCSSLGSGNRCQIYEDRPRCCREFERHSANCIFARRRVGKSGPWPLTPVPHTAVPQTGRPRTVYHGEVRGPS
jgi:hypothetical protein